MSSRTAKPLVNRREHGAKNIGKLFTAAELTRKVREVLDEKDGLRGE